MQFKRRTKYDFNEFKDAHLDDYINSDEKDPDDKSKYYDWQKTLSYDADVTMVVGARGVGKTYGLRKQLVKDYLKRGYRFVEVCRFKNEISAVAADYFSRIEANEEFKDYMFKTTPKYAYIARKTEEEKVKVNNRGEMQQSKVKIKWEMFGYFVALSDFQNLKKRTFHSVKRIILDEAILDKRDRYHHYLPNEFFIVANIVDTVSRERPDEKSIEPRLYLLGNALDLFNPYFEKYQITDKPNRGYSWHKNKTMLLDYVESNDYSLDKLKNTVAGRMIDETIEGKIEAGNEFLSLGLDFIQDKTSTAVYYFSIFYKNVTYAIWVDFKEGFYFVTDKKPKNSDKPTFVLTASDARLNYIMAKKADRQMQLLTESFYMGIMRFKNVKIMNGFIELMTIFGVKR